MREQWLEVGNRERGKWEARHFCVYRVQIRANNDVEGWHFKLNKDAGRPDLYKLLSILNKKAASAALDIQFVRKGKEVRKRRRRDVERDAVLRGLWDELDEGKITSNRFLGKAGKRVKRLLWERILGENVTAGEGH